MNSHDMSSLGDLFGFLSLYSCTNYTNLSSCNRARAREVTVVRKYRCVTLVDQIDVTRRNIVHFV
jgi:hypothetical protein